MGKVMRELDRLKDYKTIEKYFRGSYSDIFKYISKGIRQQINEHGDIKREDIGSVTKRVHGALKHLIQIRIKNIEENFR